MNIELTKYNLNEDEAIVYALLSNVPASIGIISVTIEQGNISKVVDAGMVGIHKFGNRSAFAEVDIVNVPEINKSDLFLMKIRINDEIAAMPVYRSSLITAAKRDMINKMSLHGNSKELTADYTTLLFLESGLIDMAKNADMIETTKFYTTLIEFANSSKTKYHYNEL